MPVPEEERDNDKATFNDVKVGIAVGNGGIVVLTFDGGAEWRTEKIGTGDIKSVDIDNEGFAWFADGSQIYKLNLSKFNTDKKPCVTPELCPDDSLPHLRKDLPRRLSTPLRDLPRRLDASLSGDLS